MKNWPDGNFSEAQELKYEFALANRSGVTDQRHTQYEGAHLLLCLYARRKTEALQSDGKRGAGGLDDEVAAW